tara:strand:+ start:11975 stop:13678 length:1704 start_codon:yes stop_codon:yes gene_type:complete
MYCECVAAGYCPKHKFVKTQRDFELCQGINCSVNVANQYRKAWDAGKTAQQKGLQGWQSASTITVQPPSPGKPVVSAKVLNSVTPDQVPCKFRGELIRESGCTVCGSSGVTKVYQCDDPDNRAHECTLLDKIRGTQSCIKCKHGVDAFEGVLESSISREPGLKTEGGPGTELLAMYKEKGFPKCEACTELAAKMDKWGPSKCVENLDIIIDDIMPRAQKWVAENQAWVNSWIPTVASDAALRMKIKLDVMAAVRASKKNKAKVVARRKKTWASAFSYKGSDKVRFLTTSQMAADTKKLASMIPPDVTAIAGVSRSGVYPASLIAMMLHLPFYIVRQSKNDIIEAGSGWRLGKKSHDGGRVAVIDDTVMTGNSQKAIKGVVESFFESSLMCTVYCNPLAIHKPDLWAVDLPWPHLLEWNLFNSVILPSAAFDFDGILCEDCPPGSDDDGPKYLNFIQNAVPKYVVRKDPIPMIVTARIEKYREPTLAWLDQWGIRCNNLVMAPWDTLAERNRHDMATYKADHYKSFMKKCKGIKPTVFIESDVNQAARIAKISGGITVCPSAGKCFNG